MTTMLSSWAAMLLVILGSILVGQAVTRTAGARHWTGLEPAAGYAAMVAIEGVLARIPGDRIALAGALALIVVLSAWRLRRAGRGDLPPLPAGLWVTLGVTFLAINLPFAVSGHWGLLGMGYNNDLGLHLAWADWLRSGIGTEPSSGYPLGPHGLTAALSFLPGLNLATVFTGQMMAIVLLTAWTAWEAVERLRGWKRPVVAVLAAIPYLVASYYAQAAFKELAMALFLLAFILMLTRLAGHRAEDRSLPTKGWQGLILPLTLAAGIVFTFSFAGLAWPVAVVIVVLLVDPVSRATVTTRVPLSRLRHPAVIAGALACVVAVVLLVIGGSFGFGTGFGENVRSDAFGPVSPIEGFGVWLDPDYRLDGITSTPFPGLLAAVSILALLTSLWWWRQEKSRIWPAAFLGCVFIYLVSLPWMGEYALAKALVISAPVTMIVVLVALMSGPAAGWKPAQGMEFGGWVSLAVLFVVGAIASSFLVLRDASVSPTGHAGELVKFAPRVAGHSVLYMDQDRFAPWYLSGARVGVPLAEYPDPRIIENPKKPFQGSHGQATIDFDSFAPETFRSFDYVITTSAGWQSKAMPFYRRVDRTPNYLLWRRTGAPFGRPIMREGALPAKLVDCEGESGRYFRGIEGRAMLFPDAVVIDGDEWRPGQNVPGGKTASVTADLKPGRWRVSLQYFSPGGLNLTAPGYERHFQASLDGQRLSNRDTGSTGLFWPGGMVRVNRAGPVTFTVTTAAPSLLQRLTGYSRKTDLGRLVLMRATARQVVPMSRICNQWVDFYRLQGLTDR